MCLITFSMAAIITKTIIEQSDKLRRGMHYRKPRGCAEPFLLPRAFSGSLQSSILPTAMTKTHDKAMTIRNELFVKRDSRQKPFC
jgi:hypothetical protein